jgi:hypothetical protein
MSYEIYIFHREVKQKVDEGLDIDEFEPPPIDASDVDRILGRLGPCGYELTFQRDDMKEYSKTVEGHPLQLSVFDTEIAFSAGSSEAISQAIRDAHELAGSGDLVTFDPQTDEWH